jgi:hypothetical protein
MLGAARGSIGISGRIEDIWGSIVDRAAHERSKSESSPARHFVVLPKHEERLKYFSMFFLVHLGAGPNNQEGEIVTKFVPLDYGVCLENNLDWALDKNVMRQQRFAYDDTLVEFDRYYRSNDELEPQRPQCGIIYTESELRVAGMVLSWCPRIKLTSDPLP